MSFRSFVPDLVPPKVRCKQAFLVAAVALAGCGGSSPPPRLVSGTGYSFSGPGDWTVKRSAMSVALSRGLDVISVTRFTLLRRYRPELWPKVVPEIDQRADALARDQRGTVSSRATITIAGENARRYEIAYRRNGNQLVERLGFILRGKTEYELLCRFERGKSSSACDQLFETFRPT